MNSLLKSFILLPLIFGTSCNPPPELELTNVLLLDKVQNQTFKYLYDFSHPVSGWARERNS
jgi:hypothetical protein